MKAIIISIALLILVPTSANAAESQSPFVACVVELAPKLDDGISPADVVTAGVVEECMVRLKTTVSGSLSLT